MGTTQTSRRLRGWLGRGAGVASVTPTSRNVAITLLAFAGIALAARLGFWQLDRAAQKVALQTALASRGELAAIDASALARDPAVATGQYYRRIRLSGRWDPERTVFLDNRQMDGKVGFFVVTPLLIEGTGDAVLVQRGWVARHFDDRSALPVIPATTGVVEIDGIVSPPPSRLFEFAGAASGPIRQNLDIESFAAQTGLRLLPLSIRQTNGGSDAVLRRDWTAPAADVDKHYGYAFQWFAIGATIAFVYVWFRLIRPRRARRLA